MRTMRMSRGLARYGAIGGITVLLLGLTLVLLRVPAHAEPTVLTVVSTLDDHAPSSCSVTCTLRDAVTTANSMNTTNLANSVEIDLPSGTITLTQGVLMLGSATNKFATVKGFSATPGDSTIHQTASAGVFVTPNLSGVTAKFQDLTISGGSAAGAGGGALLVGGSGASVSFTNCILTGNTASRGGAIAVSLVGDLTIANSIIATNTATAGSGAGIDFSSPGGSLTINGSTISSNTVTGPSGAAKGGGVSFSGDSESSLHITRSIFDSNSAGSGDGAAGQGGAVWASGKMVATISLSSFTANTAVTGNPEVWGLGGAVFNDVGPMDITTSRFAGNVGTYGSAVLQESNQGSITANNNWWGSNVAPGPAVTHDPLIVSESQGADPSIFNRLQLHAVASPAEVAPGGTATVTATLAWITGPGGTGAFTGSLAGLPAFPGPAGAIFSNAVNGSISAPSTLFVDGVGTATFTAAAPGQSTRVDAKADGETQSAYLTVSRYDTSTIVTSSQHPSVFGQGVQFTATVTTTALGAPTTFTGSVQFKDGPGNLGAAVPVTTGGLASTPVINSLSVGSHPITADYSGDTLLNGSTATVVPAQLVDKAGTSTTAGSSPSPSEVNQPVTFTATVAAALPGVGTPTDTVQFYVDGSSSGLAPVTLTAGVATLPNVTFSTSGLHPVTATYLGNDDFTASNSPTIDQTVNGFPTTTTVTSSLTPTRYGQPVTFTATVGSGIHGTPGGMVQFGVDGSNVGDGPVALTDGVAVLGGVNNLAAGNRVVTATYTGAPTFAASTGTLTGGQVVIRARTTTAVISSANPSVFGQPVSFTATVSPVSPGGGTPTGIVAFFLDGQPLGAPVPLSSGSASIDAPSSLTLRNHTVTAVFRDTASYITSSGALAGGQDKNKADTTTAVTSAGSPSVFGQPVSFTATVSAVAPGAGTPDGTVSFYVDGTLLETHSLEGGAITTGSISNLAVGSRSVTATYDGNSTFSSGTSGTLAQVVDQASTTTTVTSATTPTVFGQPVTFTATALPLGPGAGTPTGTVEFFADGSSFGSVPLTGSSAVSPEISSLGVGTHDVTATYLGDPSFTSSTGAASQTVNAADTSVVVSSSLNPSTVEQSVLFTATVTAIAPGAGTPGGSVLFKDNGTDIGGGQALDGNGVASVSTGSLTVGTHVITAHYESFSVGAIFGSPPILNFNGSTGTLAGGQLVNAATTATGVTSSHNPSVFGETVTFTATVPSPTDATPTGTVQFGIDGVDRGSRVTVTSGSATLPGISDLAVTVTHTVTATYSGDVNHDPSTGSLAGGQTVYPADTSTTLGSSPNPSDPAQSVAFTATVTATAPGAGMPGGTVHFYVDGMAAASTGLNEEGVATFSAPLASGAHPVTATYLGDANFATSVSSPLSQVVNGHPTTTTVTSNHNPSLFGQRVYFTASVASDGGTPDGGVQFGIDGVNVGDGPVGMSGGAATFSTRTLAVGNHVVTATYAGVTNFTTSAGTLTSGQDVTRASTTTRVRSSSNASVFGEPVTFQARIRPISPGGLTVSGTVEFFLDGQHLETVQLDEGGYAYTAPVSDLTLGNHTMTAVYADSDSYITSSGVLGGGQDVNKADTTTAVTSTATPSVFGQPVSFTATVLPNAPGAGAPAGSVSFYVDGNLYESASLVGGATTTASISSLAVRDHSVTATYTGDANFNGSNSGTVTQTVDPAGTTTTVVSAKPVTVSGEPVTFTATVLPLAPGAGEPAGRVQFSADGTNFGSSITLAGGSAVSPEIGALTAGMHTVTATYIPRFFAFCAPVSFQPSCGRPQFKPSSGSTGQDVSQAGVTLTVTADPSPSVFGQTVTFSTTVTAVAPGAGVPTGTVQFSSDGNPVGGSVDVVDGVATVTDTALARGDRVIRATYLGDANFAAGTFTEATQTVNPAGTATTASVSPSPSSSGHDVTFTATVVVVAPGAGTPTGGTLQFYLDGTSFGSPAAVAGGSGSLAPTSTVSVGIHQVTATYTGDTSFSSSTSAVLTTEVVLQVDATNTVTSTAAPSRFGQPVQFVATLSGTQGTPTGTVQFLVDDVTFGGPVPLSGGVATSTATDVLLIGPHTVTATYGGSLSYRPDSGTLSHTVIPAGTATTNVSSSTNPSTFGQSVHFEATVAAVAPGAGAPSGNVEFFAGDVSLGTGTLSDGSATSPATASLTTGSHPVTARYLGDGNFDPSSGDLPSDQVVGRSDTSITVSSSQNSSTFGQAVQFTAQVAAAGNGAGVPDGTVQFVIDGTSFGSPVTLSDGSATSESTGSLASGNHSVGAVYSSSSDFNPSTGALSGGQTVGDKPGTSVAVASSKNPSIAGDGVMFSASVAPVAPGVGTPSGSVQFVIDGANAGGPVALSGGVATLSTSALGTGSHSVVVIYSGDGTFQSAAGSLAGGQTAEAAVGFNVSGYWLFGSDGGVFTFGDAGFFGSTGAMHLNAPIVAMASTPTGQGYWLFASDGGVFAFGDAGFFGSGGGSHLTAPVVAMAATPSGRGYWLATSDGSVINFGDAGNLGSLAGQNLGAPIVAMARTLSGNGYWLASSNGTVYNYGDAPGFGSLSGTRINSPVVGFAPTADGQGYWLVAADGGVFGYGNGPFLGSMGGRHLNKLILGLTSSG